MDSWKIIGTRVLNVVMSLPQRVGRHTVWGSVPIGVAVCIGIPMLF